MLASYKMWSRVSSPTIYHQRCINSVVKLGLKKKLSLSEFASHLKLLAARQEEEMKLALIMEGDLELDKKYTHLAVPLPKYLKMYFGQKSAAFKKFLNSPVIPVEAMPETPSCTVAKTLSSKLLTYLSKP